MPGVKSEGRQAAEHAARCGQEHTASAARAQKTRNMVARVGTNIEAAAATTVIGEKHWRLPALCSLKALRSCGSFPLKHMHTAHKQFTYALLRARERTKSCQSGTHHRQSVSPRMPHDDYLGHSAVLQGPRTARGRSQTSRPAIGEPMYPVLFEALVVVIMGRRE